MTPDEIPEYESHPFYPTRFFRWALTTGYLPDVIGPIQVRTLQQKWRNISGSEEWRDIPEVLIEPNVTVEEVRETNQILNDKNLATLL
jgi:hypothetical protein